MARRSVSMQSLLEINRRDILGDPNDNESLTKDQDKTNINSTLAQNLRFEGEYLTSNGVQLAISETFKQLKQHQLSTNNVQEKDQVTLDSLSIICNFIQQFISNKSWLCKVF